jgi:hypothetical protein
MTAREQFDRGYDRGNYAAAYEHTDYATAVAGLDRHASVPYAHGYTLGFFSSYEVEEVPYYALPAYAAAHAYAYGGTADAAPHTHPAPRSSTGGATPGRPRHGRLRRDGLDWGWEAERDETEAADDPRHPGHPVTCTRRCCR